MCIREKICVSGKFHSGISQSELLVSHKILSSIKYLKIGVHASISIDENPDCAGA